MNKKYEEREKESRIIFRKCCEKSKKCVQKVGKKLGEKGFAEKAKKRVYSSI